jgi:hypothetical protein
MQFQPAVAAGVFSLPKNYMMPYYETFFLTFLDISVRTILLEGIR